MSQDLTASIDLLFRDTRRRLCAPVRSVTFYAHLLLAVLVCGGLGIWNALYQCKLMEQWDMFNIAASLYTYFPAVAAAALIELTHERQPYLRSFGLLSGALFVGIFFLATTTQPLTRLIFAGIGAVLSVFFWWIANGEKDCFKDIDPNAPTPDPNTELEGDTTGWQQ
ncbi:MAG: hypothetical protein K8R23_09090 [Chthoniobacter sp.]|nr:hypothetical protein [Chthoniobacter sp.]